MCALSLSVPDLSVALSVLELDEEGAHARRVHLLARLLLEVDELAHAIPRVGNHRGVALLHVLRLGVAVLGRALLYLLVAFGVEGLKRALRLRNLDLLLCAGLLRLDLRVLVVANVTPKLSLDYRY